MKANSPNQQRSRSTRLGLWHALVGPLSRGISGTILLVLTMTSWGHADQKANDAEIPRRGGTLRLWFPSEWRSLDPAIAFDADTVPLFKERYVIAHHPRLRGTQAHPVWTWQFQQMWLSQ
jgi:hypothetical protein